MRLRGYLIALALPLLLEPGVSMVGAPTGVRAEAPTQAHAGRTDDVPRFVPDRARLASDSPERRAREALARDDHAGAAKLLEAALADAPPQSAGRIHWLLARATRHEHKRDVHLAEIAATPHPLARWAAVRLAEHLSESDPERVVRAMEPLLGGWAGARKARHLHAIALFKARKPEQAEPRLRALVQEAPAHRGAATAAMPLADLLSRREDDASRLEALQLYRRVATRAPLSDVGTRAVMRAEEVLTRLPRALRLTQRELPFEDAFQRGVSLHKARHFTDAEREFAALAERTRDDAVLACRARVEQGRAMLALRQRRLGAEHMIDVAGRCTDANVKAIARFNAARALVRLGRPEEGMAQYALLEQEAPKHRLADDALYRGALAADDMDDEAGMLDRLRAFPERYPDGDMKAEAMFTLAWRLRKLGKHGEALAILERLQQDGPDEHAEGIEGRARYWRARTLTALGRTKEASTAYADIVRELPLSYHAQQALSRLRKLDPTTAAALAKTLRPGAPQPLSFAYRPELDHPGFQSAVALLHVGELDLARRELRALGATGEHADPDLLWLVAALYDAAGQHAAASNLVRRRLGAFMQAPPSGRALSMWRIAFPNAYSPLIEDAAREAGVPAAYVRAVAREESAFNPRAVSSAHAYGLIQLIRPTAKAHAKALGLPSDPAALKRPEINLRIGSSFIRYLWKRYEDNPAIVPAAYNAGHGAADRWLAAADDQELDEWIESIPYSETRRYTRRVLQSYGIYAFLQDGALPPLSPELPKKP